MGVFFLPTPKEISGAKNKPAKMPISLDELIPEKKIGTFFYKDPKERKKSENKTDKSYASAKSAKEETLNTKLGEKEVVTMVAGHPIAEMAPYITKRNKPVASFLLAIAKKESNWGKRSPVKSGRDCYNYWGYRGGYNMTDSGYSCFDSPEQAVKEVGDRIEKLLGQQINTPSRMIVWKCGRTCAGHDPAGVAKWISDVALYYGKLNS